MSLGGTISRLLLPTYDDEGCQWFSVNSRGRLQTLQAAGVGAIPEGDCPAKCTWGKVFTTVDTMPAMSGKPARGHSVYKVNIMNRFISEIWCLNCADTYAPRVVIICLVINWLTRTFHTSVRMVVTPTSIGYATCYAGECICRISSGCKL